MERELSLLKVVVWWSGGTATSPYQKAIFRLDRLSYWTKRAIGQFFAKRGLTFEYRAASAAVLRATCGSLVNEKKQNPVFSCRIFGIKYHYTYRKPFMGAARKLFNPYPV